MSSNPEFDPLFVWTEYKYLEDDFVKSFRYLSPISSNYGVWSAHFADLLIRIGSIFDSFLKRVLFKEDFDCIIGIEEYRKKYKNIKITDYHRIFNSYYELSLKSVYNITNFEVIKPFSNWENGNYEPLEWWDAYTSLKHDRFANKEIATLKSTIHALGGLFLINIFNTAVNPFLVDYGVIVAPNLAKRHLKSVLLNKEPLNECEVVFAKTNLFGYVFDLQRRKLDEKDKMRILSPSGYVY